MTESLAERLKRKGFKPVTDTHCLECGKPINSNVNGLYCSVGCEIRHVDRESNGYTK